jgi:hypothetical protein
MDPMTRAMPSDALLQAVLLAYEGLARRIDGSGDPELGFAMAYASGRRALVARAEAEVWLVPPSVVAQLDGLTRLAATTVGEDAAAWLDAYPNRVLAILERRTGGLSAMPVPRRRWVDRVADRPPAERPTPIAVPFPR